MKIIKWRILLLICVMLCCGCSATALPDSPAKEEGSAFPEKVIALSESNAELWLLAGGSLAATSEDAMDLEGISSDTVSLGDMDHVSLEAVAALEPDLMILFSTDPAQKAPGPGCPSRAIFCRAVWTTGSPLPGSWALTMERACLSSCQHAFSPIRQG